MYLIRDVFRCRPGKAGEVARRFKEAAPHLAADGTMRNVQVMHDYVAAYWTVVLQAEVDDLGDFDRHMAEWRNHAEMQRIMSGYMELVQEGYREVFRLV
jgi:hypothetical protein